MKTAHEFLTDKGGKRSYSALEVHSMLNEHAEQFKPKWIRVEDRLPENDVKVLTYFKTSPKEGRTSFGHCYNGEWRTYNGSDLWFKITHWMPLPEPPKTA